MKKTMFIIIAALTSAALHADYLYWMVNEVDDSEKYQFSYATVKTDDSSYLSLYSTDSSTSYGTKLYNSNMVSGQDGYVTGAGYAGLIEGTDYSGSTFLFELWAENYGGDDTLVAWKSVAYSSLSGNIFSNYVTGSGSSPYVVSNLVPEPTSGMLLLIGIAGLALRRRRGYKEVNP